MALITCPSCGNTISDRAATCPRCGNPINSSQQSGEINVGPMTFSKAIDVCMKQKYATFTGRASRSEYWYFTLFEYLVYFVVFFIFRVLGSFIVDEQPGMIGLMGASLVGLAFICPALAVAVRRLHDTGKSGWYVLVNAIPSVGSIVFIVFMCLASEKKANKYGALSMN